MFNQGNAVIKLWEHDGSCKFIAFSATELELAMDNTFHGQYYSSVFKKEGGTWVGIAHPFIPSQIVT
ncbi:MAG: hypothetical protein MI784_11725 [Cytophagales bacterium]|nr:hypothetical protein [Cytophagales bacterium]